MISLKKSKNVWNYKGTLLDRHGKIIHKVLYEVNRNFFSD